MIKIDIKDSDVLIKRLGERFEKAKQAGIYSAANRLLQHIVTVVVPGEKPPPTDQGLYNASWEIEQIRNGAILFNTAPHAAVIEHGARAENIKVGRKMIDALAEWVVRKGLLGKGKGSIQTRSQEQEAQSTAWAIAQNMRKRGIFNRDAEGLHIAEKASKKAPQFVIEEIKAELEEALRG